MKKSLLVCLLCLAAGNAYAQDDDVYFVPSSKSKSAQTNNQNADTYVAGRSSYTQIDESETFQSSNWAQGRGSCGRDVDEYNRRGKNYKQSVADTLSAQSIYDQGYDDGYEDGSCTSRIVRFYSPRAGVYVSSPYYLDYYDFIDYDPWYYGYGTPWSWGWSGWHGWGSWYGWRPYYASWGWGWNHGWHDHWFGYGPGFHHGWGHPGYAWHPSHPIAPANAQRGPVGGWTARGGSRGAGMVANRTTSGRGNSSLGLRTPSSRGGNSVGFFNRAGSRAQNSGNTIDNRQPSTNRSNSGRNFFSRPSNNTSTPSSSSNSVGGSSNSRSYTPSSPSRSSFGSGGSFSGGSRGGFSGGGSHGGRGGGRGR